MPEIYVKNKEQGLLIMLKFYEYMPTIMEYLADDSSHSSKEIRKFCCDKLSISVEEQQVTISSRVRIDKKLIETEIGETL